MAQRLTGAPADPLENRSADSFIVKGRLQPGVSRESAQAELSTIWKNLARQYPEAARNRSVAVRTELQARIQQSPPDAMLVGMLMALVGLVLIIACANVANLMLGRARSRSREIAIRIALGVGRTRLLRQLLTESLVLSFVSALLGLALADSGIRALQNIRPPSDLPIVISPQLDHRVLLFTLLASVLSAIFFGLAPASQTLKMQLVPALKGASLGFSAGSRTIGRSTLVVAQVALSMVLLVAAGMLLDGFQRSLVLNPGYRTDHLMMFEFETSLVRYTGAQTRDFYRNLVNRTRALPDVRSAALARSIPFSPNQFVTNVIPEGYQFPKGQTSASIFTNVVDEHYFGTTKMPMVDGREFAASDKAESRRVAIVNEQFAKTYWPGQNPIGKRLRLNDAGGPWLDVVGVAKTAKYLFIGETATPFLYIPFAQHQNDRMTLVVETYGDPASIAGPVRDVVRSLDPSQPVYNVRTFANHYQQRAIAIPRLIMQTVGGMGLLGLTLALVGIYGLIAYSVSRRTREIGIRMAIGGNKASILAMVLRQGFKLSVLGILAGSVVSFGVARVLAAGLAGIGSPNPLTFVLVPVALIVITLTACYIPARRASLIDPVTALRHE
jgi:predicted permease